MLLKQTAQEITKYDIFRVAAIDQFFTEMYGYYDDTTQLLGIIIYDKTDHDYAYLILKRQQPDHKYRTYKIKTSYKTPEKAEKDLLEEMKHKSQAITN
jgi:hypothetical protein